MLKESFLKDINYIFGENIKHGLKVFVCIKEDGNYKLNKFNISELLEKDIDKLIFKTVQDNFINDDFEYQSIDDINDNKKSLYNLIQDNIYYPFEFLNNYNNVDTFLEENENNIIGYFIKFNINSKIIWIYQNAYVGTVISNKKLINLVKIKGVYEQLKTKLFRINSTIDLIIIDNEVFVSNLGVLQKVFKFEKYIKKEAKNTINIIRDTGFIQNIDKILTFNEKDNITNSKKLMKVKNSPVLKMQKEKLIDRIKIIPKYRDSIKIEDNKIQITSLKDVANLLKLLNDEYLKSELTDEEYESSIKKLLSREVK